MKKRLFILLMAAVLLISSVALGEQVSNRVFDYADLFSAPEEEGLEAGIVEFQQATGYDFAILVSSTDYGYDDYQELCDEFFESESLGLGMNKTAILCYLDLSGDGHYYVSVFGDLKYLMANEEILYLAESALEYFYDGDFSGGFMWTMEFLSQALTEIGKVNQSWRVFDNAVSLSDTEIETMEAAIAEFRALSGMDFLYLSTIEEMDGNEDGDYMQEFFQAHGFGSGDNLSGTVVYLDFYSGSYYIQNFGDMVDIISSDSLNVIVQNVSELMGESKILSAVLQILDNYSAYFK